MDLLNIIGIILLGVVLIAVEVIFVPGTTVIGFLGFFIIVGGIYLSFTELGNTYGSIITILTILIITATTYYAMKKKVWRRFSLNTEITGKVDANVTTGLTIGTEGKTISALRPLGTAEFNNKRIEVSSLGSFVDARVNVKIISIDKKKIIVEAV